MIGDVIASRMVFAARQSRGKNWIATAQTTAPRDDGTMHCLYGNGIRGIRENKMGSFGKKHHPSGGGVGRKKALSSIMALSEKNSMRHCCLLFLSSLRMTAWPVSIRTADRISAYKLPT